MITLYDYWRSSAAYRLRIALGLLNLPYTAIPVDLLKGEHRQTANLARNPQGLVPTLEVDGQTLTQSLAILEYLDETRGAHFLPKTPVARARTRALAYAVAMEIHPVCNLSVARHAVDASNGAITIEGWMQHFIRRGLTALETMLAHPATGRFCHGDQITIADICLVPQVYNAHRWGVDVTSLSQINRIIGNLSDIPAIAAAHPDRHQPKG
ncbi:MAG: maleylacetoacetate isomerase [Paracoccaceae bacterium]